MTPFSFFSSSLFFSLSIAFFFFETIIEEINKITNIITSVQINQKTRKDCFSENCFKPGINPCNHNPKASKEAYIFFNIPIFGKVKLYITAANAEIIRINNATIILFIKPPIIKKVVCYNTIIIYHIFF